MMCLARDSFGYVVWPCRDSARAFRCVFGVLTDNGTGSRHQLQRAQELTCSGACKEGDREGERERGKRGGGISDKWEDGFRQEDRLHAQRFKDNHPFQSP